MNGDEVGPGGRAHTVVVGVDPGRRIGVAWVDAGGRLRRAEVVAVDALEHLCVPRGVAIALGDGTGSRAVRRRLEAAGYEVDLVDERASSERGRALYWRTNPPTGWLRWVPVGLRSPPADLDAYAAYAIALRWLAGHGYSGSSTEPAA